VQSNTEENEPICVCFSSLVCAGETEHTGWRSAYSLSPSIYLHSG